MRKKLFFIIMLLSLAVFLMSCQFIDSSATEDKDDFDNEDYEALITPNNALAFKLLEHVEPNDEQNIFVSPTSLVMALSMVYNGAEGKSKDEINEALQIGSISKDELNKANASLIARLAKQSDDIDVHIANSIWLNDDFRFQENFAEDNEHYFEAEISEIDVKDGSSPKRINDWVSEKTHGKIEDIVPQRLSQGLVTILINALYFNGNWTFEFDEGQTEKRPFHVTPDNPVETPFMFLKEELAYFDDDVVQAISLPYGEGEMSMDIYLPQEDVSVDEFKAGLTEENWTNWQHQFVNTEGILLLPKFDMAYETVLNDALQALGMETVFTEDANLSAMISKDTPIWISDVRQKTYIDVHEKGTEAAGATSVEIVETALIDEEPFEMEVNRPFFFVIKDTETNMIIFTGIIENPE